jgi:hypothetical protein
LKEEGVYPRFGVQLRYWRFDFDDSVYAPLFKWWVPRIIFEDTEADVFPMTQILFLSPQFGVERRRGQSALSFDLAILGTTLYTKVGEIGEIDFNIGRWSLFPYFSVGYAYYF